jgi:hypothetical protein
MKRFFKRGHREAQRIARELHLTFPASNPSCPVCDGTGTRCPEHDTDLDQPDRRVIPPKSSK